MHWGAGVGVAVGRGVGVGCDSSLLNFDFILCIGARHTALKC